MKKICLFCMAVLMSAQMSSQQFFTKTTYRGAFGSEDWTAGWANWDPQGTAYPATTTTVSADITTNTTWTTGSVVLLQNKVYVTGGAVLTIEPGVIIRGDKATEGTLIISRGSQIMAQGTMNNPIVFTSNQASGSRSLGDWGGLIVLGASPTNQATTTVIEGGLDAVKAQYGGSTSADNSGTLQYIRIEYGGFPFQPDKEINGLTMGGVGSGTTIDHIQVSFNNDDAFEWFGGNVNCKYLISYRNLDDDFDTDYGFSGKVQFGLIVRDPAIADQSASSTSEGFESDNDGTGTAATPKTSAIFSNITLIGPYRGSTGNTIDGKFRRALRIRRNSAISVFNSVFTDFPTGFHVDGSASEANATNSELVFKCNTLAGMGMNLQVNSGSAFNIKSYFATNNNDSIVSATGIKLKNPYSFTAPDFRPDDCSPLWSGACWDDPKVSGASYPVQGFFTRTTYRGAFGSEDWTAGWANWDPQGTAYPATTTTVSADITTNTTWTTGTVVLLQNKVYVTGSAILTIEPGVIIRGDKATEGTLIISRGSQIIAQGTSANPIVFTSNQASGSRSLGDWGGLIVLGAAPTNQPATTVIEGGLDAVKAQYGGSNSSDNSGILQYVRIEYGGFPFQPDKEINGLTMGGVGSGTTIDHIQVSFNNDDAYEWFGGNVNCKYLISYRNLDDDFDTDYGFSGKVQFGLIVRDPAIADQSSSSTSEGFESDNDGTGTAATPKTSAIFSNITLIGPYRGSTGNTIDGKFRRALRIRRNSAISVFNSVFTDFPTGFHVDGSASEANATNNELVFKCNTLAGMGMNLQVNSGSAFNIKSYFATNNNDSIVSATGIKLKNPYNFTAPDFRPDTCSPLWASACFDANKLDMGVGIVELIKNKKATVDIALYPNPANDAVTISYNLLSASNVNIRVIDINGKRVEEISNQQVAAGNHVVHFSVSEYRPGMYFVLVNTPAGNQAVKLIVNQ